MRGSLPTAPATSSTSAPVASHSAEMELMLLMRCARNALATSLDSSDDHRFDVMMRSRGTHCAYTFTSVWAAFRPPGVWREPISTRPGSARSFTAVPSAKNSGFDRMWNSTPLSAASSTRCMACAVRTGTVDFST